MKKQESTNYCLGDALMEERSCQAKWVVRKKLETIYNYINETDKDDICRLSPMQVIMLKEYLQDILNIVENEL